MILLHKTSQRKFEYIGEYMPQFTTVTQVRLKNLTTNNIEIFNKSTYLQFFTVVN